MSTTNHEFAPDYAFPPGATIKEYIDSQNIERSAFAADLGVSPTDLDALLVGTLSLSERVAERLEAVTGMSAAFWRNLESQYQEHLSQEWLSHVPTDVLEKRGFIPEKLPFIEKVQATLRFFGVSDLHEWHLKWANLPAAARRASTDKHPHPAATWIRFGELEVSINSYPATDVDAFRNQLAKIRPLSRMDPKEFLPALHSQCADCGVVLLLVPEFKGLAWHGATIWKDGTAIIMLNIRGKQEDKFWFSFFHEAGHVINGDGKAPPVDEAHEMQMENEANDFAAKILFGDRRSEIPRLASARDLRRFAEELHISPGIVAGQYQYMTRRWDRFHGLIRKFKWNGDV